MEDKHLILAYQEGDEKAFEALIHRYLRPIYNFAFGYTGNQHDAEDVTQETFVKTWKNLSRFDQQKKFKAWIFSIAKHTALDVLKKKKTVPFSQFEDHDGRNAMVEALADDAPLPSELYEQADAFGTLVRFIQKLSEPYRQVLDLYYQKHLTFQEIADALGEPLHTVKSRHRRSLLRLKKIMAPK